MNNKWNILYWTEEWRTIFSVEIYDFIVSTESFIQAIILRFRFNAHFFFIETHTFKKRCPQWNHLKTKPFSGNYDSKNEGFFKSTDVIQIIWIPVQSS